MLANEFCIVRNSFFVYESKVVTEIYPTKNNPTLYRVKFAERGKETATETKAYCGFYVKYSKVIDRK